MSEDKEKPKSPYDKFYSIYSSPLTGPANWFRANVVAPLQGDRTNQYYHRRYRRIPGIDECDEGDQLCFYEVNQQFKRDKLVDSEILAILRQRRLECEWYYQGDKPKYCTTAKDDYEQAETNWFSKYGDLGAGGTVLDAYMKQKHRMIWERRHGPVGTGMRTVEDQVAA